GMLADICLSVVSSGVGAPGSGLTSIIQTVTGEPNVSATFKHTLLGRYYALLALSLGRREQRRMMRAYAFLALKYDRTWITQRREITVGLLEMSIGKRATGAMRSIARPTRRLLTAKR